MASSLATRGVENGALSSYGLSLLGHVFLAACLFLLPSSGKKIFVDQVPRSVKLIATLDTPAPPPRPAAKPRRSPPPPPPPPKAAPRVSRPSPPPPPAASSRIKEPSRSAPPLIRPRETPRPQSSSLGDKLANRLSDIQNPPPPPADSSVPAPSVPDIAPLEPPSIRTVAVPAGAKLVAKSSFPFPEYLNQVYEIVSGRWQPPSLFTLGGKRHTAVVAFRIHRDGRITGIEFESGSGHKLFDQTVLAALAGLSALPPLPEGFKEEHIDVGIRLSNQ